MKWVSVSGNKVGWKSITLSFSKQIGAVAVLHLQIDMKALAEFCGEAGGKTKGYTGVLCSH